MKKDIKQADRSRKYYLKNRDTVIARSKKWKEDNPERRKKWKILNKKKHAEYAKKYDKKYREKNKERISSTKKKYREDNKSRLKEYFRENYMKNRKKKLAKSKVYYQKNKQKRNKYNASWRAIKRRTEPSFRVVDLLRHRLWTAFQLYSSGKKVKTADEYGINYQKICDHLGPMPNDGEKYHIDHIVPICLFDFDDTDQIKKAFAPENHQWLTQFENLSKGSKIN